MNLINVFDSIKKNGGATYCINTSELNPRCGFIVSLVGYEKIVEVPETFAQFQEVFLAYCTRDIWDQIGGREDIYFGFWIDNNQLYIDLSERIENKEAAILLGVSRNQLAIWDANAEEKIELIIH